MIRRFSINFSVFALFLDTFLVGFSLHLANQFRPLLNELPFVFNLSDPVIPLPLYPIFAFLWVLILVFFSVYDGRKNVSFANELVNLVSGSFFAGIASAGVLYLSFRDISRLLFLTFFGLCIGFQLGWRVLWRWITGRAGGAAQDRRVLIVGANAIGKAIGQKIVADASQGLRLAGYADDSPSGPLPAERLGGIGEVGPLVQARGIDDVLVALPAEKHQEVTRLIMELQLLPVKVWIIPEFFQLALFRAALDDFAGIPMLDLRASALSDPQRIAKRMLDLLVSVPILVLGLPVMAMAALAIRLDSGRPVIYSQDRVGENGGLFRIYKFRTMVQGADEMLAQVTEAGGDGVKVHKRLDDPRVTRIGRWLRRSSLDELPQFWNVLLGNMSLVGPRPEIPEIVQQYEPWQHQRFAVPPGITGWWQITGRSEKVMHLHTDEDIYYIENYSILLDLQIMVRTIGVVLSGRGAY